MPPEAPREKVTGPGARLPDARAITARLARGDQEAFAVFYEATFDNAVADAHRLTGKDESFCLDAVQDAYLRAAKRLPAIDSWGACRTWLRTAIASSAVDRIRSDTARAKRESMPRDTTTNATEHGERLQDLLDRLQTQLDDRQWHAVRLHIGGGLPLSAVGRAMSLSRHAVHGLVRRGVANLSNGNSGGAAPGKGDSNDA
ncbi:MAG: sigma-70 family RNA polymerase sigma factor [Phycisphaera sp.]|nr:MAG: sigma-70 family RNA polymerase sigma factor [Phycisphaera sp.]